MQPAPNQLSGGSAEELLIFSASQVCREMRIDRRRDKVRDDTIDSPSASSVSQGLLFYFSFRRSSTSCQRCCRLLICLSASLLVCLCLVSSLTTSLSSRIGYYYRSWVWLVSRTRNRVGDPKHFRILIDRIGGLAPG